MDSNTVDYDNINHRVDLLYEYMYNRNKNYDYTYKSKSILDITIDDIKESSPKKYYNLLKDLQYKWTINNDLAFIKKLDSYNVLIHIGVYDKYNTNYNDRNRGEMVNMIMPYVLTDLIKNDCKYISIPIMNFDISYNDLYITSSSLAKTINNIISVNDKDYFYVNIYEYYFEQIPLKNFIDNHNLSVSEWKLLLFKIIYALSKIITYYPAFRHNNLTLNSIYVSLKNKYKEKHLNVKQVEYKLPENDYEIKFTSFHKSVINDIIENNSTDKILENNYYDLHYILHTINSTYSKTLPQEIKLFINDIIPVEYRYKENFNGLDETNYNEKTKYNPIHIITKNIFFSEYIKDLSMSTPNINRSKSSKKDASSISLDTSEHVTIAKKSKYITGTRLLNNSTVDTKNAVNKELSKKKKQKPESPKSESSSNSLTTESISVSSSDSSNDNNNSSSSINKSSESLSVTKSNSDSSTSPKSSSNSSSSSSSFSSSSEPSTVQHNVNQNVPQNVPQNAVQNAVQNVQEPVNKIAGLFGVNPNIMNNNSYNMPSMMGGKSRRSSRHKKSSKHKHKSRKQNTMPSNNDLQQQQHGLFPQNYQSMQYMNPQMIDPNMMMNPMMNNPNMNNPMMNNQMMNNPMMNPMMGNPMMNPMMGNQMMGNQMMGMNYGSPDMMEQLMDNYKYGSNGNKYVPPPSEVNKILQNSNLGSVVDKTSSNVQNDIDIEKHTKNVQKGGKKKSKNNNFDDFFF